MAVPVKTLVVVGGDTDNGHGYTDNGHGYTDNGHGHKKTSGISGSFLLFEKL